MYTRLSLTIAAAIFAATPASGITFSSATFGYQYKLGGSHNSYTFANSPKSALISQTDRFVESLGTISTTSTVRVSHATGSVGVQAVAGNGVGPSTGVGDYASIVMKDTLYVDALGFSANSNPVISFGYDIYGSLGFPSSFVHGSLIFHNLTNGVRSSASVEYSGFNGSTVSGIPVSEHIMSGNSKLGPGSYQLNIALAPGVTNVISLQSWMFGFDGVSFLNSAKISSRSGPSFTSASGVFLQGEQIAPVPIPPQLPMIIAS